jgi:hypothetical protein
MQRIGWLKYKDKKILFCDYSGAALHQLLELFDKFNKVVLKLNSTILFLADFSDTKVDKTILQRLKDAESRMVAKKFDKAAVVGIVGLKKTILNFYNAVTDGNVKAFPDKKQALEWLVTSNHKDDRNPESFIKQKNHSG